MDMSGKKNRATSLILVIWAVALSFVVFYVGYVYYVDSPVSAKPQEEPITIEISKGDSFTSVMNVLESVGLIKHRKSFYLLAILRGAPKHIRAGEYELDTAMTPREILDKFLKGEIKGYRMPIPEGFTVHQIAARLSHWRLVDEKAFMERAYNKDFLASLYIPGDSIEGYLFPDTYILTRSMGEEEIMKFMVRRFRQKVTSTMMQRAGELGFTFEEILILASIIEKEGGLNEEKPLVAAVFHNRLQKGMRLQSDPTVIYGIKNFDGNLTKKHLKKVTRYNTYRIKGLPPGPICNPGIDSIMAALYPSPANYLFFVSKNDGSHHFSADLATHNKAVLKYQIKRRR